MALKKFVQAVAFPLTGADGKVEFKQFGLTQDNKPMVHDVPDEILEHEHFQQYVDAGYILNAQSEQSKLESLQERNERLAAKLAAAGIAEDPEPEVAVEAPSEEEGESKKSKKKR